MKYQSLFSEKKKNEKYSKMLSADSFSPACSVLKKNQYMNGILQSSKHSSQLKISHHFSFKKY